MAYFEEVRIRGGASQNETATLMGKSLRTIGNLERQFRSDFFAPARELEFARDVEAVLSTAQKPMTIKALMAQAPHIDEDDISGS